MQLEFTPQMIEKVEEYANMCNGPLDGYDREARDRLLVEIAAYTVFAYNNEQARQRVVANRFTSLGAVQ